jgi:hypothetical protein
MNPVLIHNQCSDFELIPSAYFGRNTILLGSPDQKVDANSMTRTSFGKHVISDEFAGALICKLQRKKYLEYNDQPNENNTSTEDTSTSLQLLVIWGSNDEYRFSVRALLIKHSNTITWNEDILEKLHSMYLFLCRNNDIVEDTWLLDDTTILVTTFKLGKDNDEITISEGTRKNDTREPLWVSSNM